MDAKVEQRSYDNLKSILLLAGAFIFAFLLGELIHEFGHYLGHRAYGNTEVQVHLDPFGGTRMEGDTASSLSALAVTAATGPLSNLAVGIVCFLLFWRLRRPLLLPLLLLGPVAMVQEGITFSLGLLTPGGDAQWIASAGIPKFAILGVGIALLAAGLVGVSLLLPYAGIKQSDSSMKKLLIVLVGMCSLMLVRATHSILAAPEMIIENLIPLILSGLLAVIVVLLHAQLTKLVSPIAMPEAVPITWSVSLVALILGAAVFTFQVVAFN